jgi:hypothetical protein
MKKRNNGQRDDVERYALPKDLRRRLIEASGRDDPMLARFEDTNVVDLKQWRQERTKDRERR